MTSSGANEALLAAYAQHLATQPARTREAYLRDVGVLKALAGEAARFNAFSTSARISGGMSRFFSAASTALRCSDEKRVGAT